MDGIHDLGGKQGFGAVDTGSGKRPLERWEQRVFAMLNGALAAGLIGNIDQFRHSIERIDPAAYLVDGYFGRWLGGIETLLVEKGVVATGEIDAQVQSAGGEVRRVAARPMRQADRVSYPPGGRNGQRALARPPRYRVGEQVVTASHGVSGHTRLPQYARGRVGTIVAWHQGWVFPDSNAHGRGENPEHLYTVRFSGETLWGESSEPGTVVNIDLFEPYLHPASDAGGECDD
jgi:nitrile hydratase